MPRDFNGTSDQLNPGDATAIDITSLSATVGAWVNADTIEAVTNFHHCIIGRGRGGTSGWKLGIGGSNNTAKLIFTKKQVADIASPTITLTTGAWFYIAAVLTGSNVRFVKIDTAGTLTSESSTANSSAMDNTPTPSETRIGCDRSAAGANADFFDGKIAFVDVWVGSQLTDAQIKALAFQGIGAIGSLPNGSWPLWGSHSPEPDMSGNGKDATVTGAVAEATAPPRRNWATNLASAGSG